MVSLETQSDCRERILTKRFELEVIPLRSELMRAAMRMTNNRADAEDLVQDAFLRAYRGFAAFRAGTNARAWMHRILRNTWINNYRVTTRRVTEVPMPEHADRLDDPVEGVFRGTASPEYALLATEPDAEVRSAMAALTDDFRTVVYLADVEGYPYATIAEMMNTPLGTVMSRLHRARRQLRDQLGGAAAERPALAA